MIKGTRQKAGQWLPGLGAGMNGELVFDGYGRSGMLWRSVAMTAEQCECI